MVQIFRVCKQCCFKHNVELSAHMVVFYMKTPIRVCVEAVRGAGGREGGQEEDKEVALVGAHLHKKQEESMETVHLVRHNSNCQLHSTMGPGKETSTKLLH